METMSSLWKSALQTTIHRLLWKPRRGLFISDGWRKNLRKGHSWNHRTPKIMNCVLLHRMRKNLRHSFPFAKNIEKSWNKNGQFVYLHLTTGSLIKRRTNREEYSRTSSENYYSRNSFRSSRQNWHWARRNWIMLRKLCIDQEVHEWEQILKYMD